MENDKLRDIIKMDFPDVEIDNEKIISLCKNQKNRVNKSIILKLVLSLSCVILVMVTILTISYNGINEKNLSGKNNETKETTTTNENQLQKLEETITNQHASSEYPNPIGKSIDSEFVNAFLHFASESLYKSADKERSTFISPYSIYSALALVANGSNKETREQFENVFGLSIGKLNEYLLEYAKKLVNGDGVKIDVAHSIWVNEDRMKVNEEYLLKTKAYYDSSVYTEPFTQVTVDKINGWVKYQTHDMIDKIIDDLSPDAVMCLLNTIYFDALWEKQYELKDLWPDIFTNYNASESSVTYLKSKENYYYINDKYSALKKMYEGGKYSFVAIMPNSETDIYDFAYNMDGEKYLSIMDNLKSENENPVKTLIPILDIEFGIDDMSDILSSMGLDKAFNPVLADFSFLGETHSGENIYIGRVVHKAKLLLNESGTKASAVTEIGVDEGLDIDDLESIYLNRPFMIFIVDNETNIPLFSGIISYLKSNIDF